MKSAYKIKWYQYYRVVLYYIFYIFLAYGLYKGFYKDNEINFKLKIILLVFYIFTLTFTFYYHIKCVLTDNSLKKDEHDLKTKELTKAKNFCVFCNNIKPERTHHCKVCGLCIKKMDHHCVWISNCVGEGNIREFVYLLLGNIFSFLLTFLLLIKPLNIQVYKHDSKLTYNKNLSIIKKFLFLLNSNIITIVCILSFIGFVYVLLLFLAFLFNCIKYNMTQIELKIYEDDLSKCPYFKNNIKENFLKIIKPFPFSFNLTNNFNESENNVKINTNKAPLINVNN